MKHKLVLACSFLSILSSINLNAQTNSEEIIQDALYTLKEYIRDWSCDRFVKGSFTENIEISLKDKKLIIQSNFSNSDAEYFRYPEYAKALIELSAIRSVSIQETEKQCAGIKINTKLNGIQVIYKYRNSSVEVPMPKELEFREKFGWVNDAIRLNKNSNFEERSIKVVNLIKQIAILSGNTLLEENRISGSTEKSNQNVIKMKSVDGVSVIPCKVNGLNLNFIFDTGASNVSISMAEATFMLKNDYLNKSDIIGANRYQDANGNINQGVVVNLKEIEIGNIKLFNIKATIVKNNLAPLLLGQSAIKQLGKLELDLQNNTLEIGQFNPANSQLKLINDLPPLSPSVILGKHIQLGELRIAEFDFPQIMEWAEAKKYCSILGPGWRLPSESELMFISKNKQKIANIKPYSYWSANEVDSENAISILFSEHESYVDKKKTQLFVRAVKSTSK